MAPGGQADAKGVRARTYLFAEVEGMDVCSAEDTDIAKLLMAFKEGVEEDATKIPVKIIFEVLTSPVKRAQVSEDEAGAGAGPAKPSRPTTDGTGLVRGPTLWRALQRFIYKYEHEFLHTHACKFPQNIRPLYP